MPSAMDVSRIIVLLEPFFDKGDTYMAAEHDIVYFPCRNKDLPKEKAEALEKLGAHWSSEGDCWAAFV